MRRVELPVSDGVARQVSHQLQSGVIGLVVMRAWTSSRSKQNASMLLHELSLDWPTRRTLIGVVGTILAASGRSRAVVALGLGESVMAGANLWQPVSASRDIPAGHRGGPPRP